MRFPRVPLSALLFVGALALSSPSAHADRVDVVLPLKGKTEGSIDAPDDSTTLAFLVTESDARKVKISVKRAKKSKLEPSVRLIAPSGRVFDPAAEGGKAKQTSKSYAAKLAGVPAGETGLWKVEIRSANDTTGGFRFAVSGKDLNKKKGSETVPLGGTKDVEFQVGSDCEVLLKAKRSKGSSVSPQVQILDPNGNALLNGAFLGTSNKSGSSLSLKKFRLPVFGTYTARFSGKPGTGGGFSYAITTKPAKIKGTLPTADAGSAFEAEPGIEAHLEATTDAGNPAYLWTQVSGEPVELAGPNGVMPLFSAPSTTGTLAFQLSISQAGVLSRAATVAVEVTRRPLADAGRSQIVATSALVTLDGSASLDRSALGLRFAWEQDATDAQQVTLDDPASATPSFDAPAVDAVLRFRLTVDDGTARSFADEVVVAVGNTSMTVADAGRNQIASRMATIHLSGLASQTASGLVGDTLAWTQLTGPVVTLDGADTPFPSFTAPRTIGDMLFRVTADGDATTADEVLVSVRDGEDNRPARASAGGNSAIGGASFQLSAAGTTDPDADDLTFRWAQTFGDPTILDDPTAADTTGTIPAPASFHAFAVQANDGLQYGAPDQATRYDASNGAPIADAGTDVTVFAGQQVTLDGLGSVRTDGGTDPITYLWEQVSGNDWYDVAAEDPGFEPTFGRTDFILPISVSSLTPSRTLTFELTVNDGTQDSAPDLVTVSFVNLPLNAVPEVTAGASELDPIVGTVVTLNGTANDRDGDPVTVLWQQTAGPTVQLTPGNTTLSPQFTTPATGPLTFRLVGNDGFDDSLPAQVTIDVDEKPVAIPTATPPTGDEGTTVTMDASTSFDPEGNTVTYDWAQTAGTPLTFNAMAESFQFSAPIGSVTFLLTVNDGRQDSDSVQITFSGSIAPDTNPTAQVGNVNTSPNDAPYGASVTLRANPPAATAFTFTWRQLNPNQTDPSVTISSTTAENPTFSVPLPGSNGFGTSPSVTLGVIASNGSTNSVEKTVRINLYASLSNTQLTSSSNTAYGIVSLNCTSCHSGTANNCNGPGGSVGSGSNAQGLGMGSKAAFRTNTLGVTACKNSSLKRIVAGSASTSDLVLRMQGTGGIMPAKGSVSATQIAIIKDWVDQGAKDN